MSEIDQSKEGQLAHPLRADTAMIPTNAVNGVITTLNRWLHYLIPGGIFHGLSRVGKSQIAKCLVTDTERLLGAPIPAAGLSMVNPDDSTKPTLTANRLYIELLGQLGHPADNSSNTVRKRTRLVNLMCDRARQANENRFLLVIDEAQFITKAQYGFLIDLHNQLDMKKIKLTTVLVGDPRLVENKTTYMELGEGHIIGRFMVAEHEVRGVEDLESIALICRAMDSMSEHPPGSGISFTHHFAPRAFENGWRLESLADPIWTAFHDVCRMKGVKPFVDLPMAPVIALLRVILIMIGESDDSDPELEPAQIRSLISEVAWGYMYAHIIQTERLAKGRKKDG